MSQYWAHMASVLTSQDLDCGMDLNKDMSLALTQLSNLQSLGLDTEDVEGGSVGPCACTCKLLRS